MPQGGCRTDRANAREVAGAGIRLGRAVEDSMGEGLGGLLAPWASKDGVSVPPVRVSGEIGLPGPHLVDPARRESIETHERMGRKGWSEAVRNRRWRL